MIRRSVLMVAFVVLAACGKKADASAEVAAPAPEAAAPVEAAAGHSAVHFIVPAKAKMEIVLTPRNAAGAGLRAVVSQVGGASCLLGDGTAGTKARYAVPAAAASRQFEIAPFVVHQGAPSEDAGYSDQIVLDSERTAATVTLNGSGEGPTATIVARINLDGADPAVVESLVDAAVRKDIAASPETVKTACP